MARLKPIKPEDRTRAQASAYQAIEAKGGRLGGPYSALIRIPEFMLLLGENGLAETVATTGFYSLVSMTLVAFDVDPPAA